MTLVLPVPAPAKINCGESQYITASFCSLFNHLKMIENLLHYYLTFISFSDFLFYSKKLL